MVVTKVNTGMSIRINMSFLYTWMMCQLVRAVNDLHSNYLCCNYRNQGVSLETPKADWMVQRTLPAEYRTVLSGLNCEFVTIMPYQNYRMQEFFLYKIFFTLKGMH